MKVLDGFRVTDLSCYDIVLPNSQSQFAALIPEVCKKQKQKCVLHTALVNGAFFESIACFHSGAGEVYPFSKQFFPFFVSAYTDVLKAVSPLWSFLRCAVVEVSLQIELSEKKTALL